MKKNRTILFKVATILQRTQKGFETVNEVGRLKSRLSRGGLQAGAGDRGSQVLGT